MTLQRSHSIYNEIAVQDNDTVSIDVDALVRSVDDLMMNEVQSEVPVLTDASRHIISSGGKRIRPQLLLLTYLSLGGRDLEYAMPVAAAIELVHTASVVHDDINDHGMVRRGRESVNAKWGRTFALLTGDYLFTKVYDLMADYGRANRVVSDATTALVEGETLQAYAVKNNDLSREVYMRVIALKTAELFRAAGKLGAMFAETDEHTIEEMGEFGFNIGMAFQIVDDILDLTADSEQTGKTSNLDVDQGKGIASIVGDEPQDPMAAIKAKALAGDAIEKGRMLAQSFVNQAEDNLDVLPDGPEKEHLRALNNQPAKRT
ncbi:MAG: polyprenyl synthetase family protein, partial [Chloroflexota bacterium]